MKKMIVGVLVICLILLLTACSEKDYYNPTETKESQHAYSEHVEGKLYYIPHEYGKADFPSKYKMFIDEHPELKVVGVEGDLKENTHNAVNGMFIFTELKEETVK